MTEHEQASTTDRATRALGRGAIGQAVSVTLLTAILAGLHLFPWGARRWISFDAASLAMIALQAELVWMSSWLVLGPGPSLIRFAGTLAWSTLVWLTGFQVALKLPIFSTPYTAMYVTSVAVGLLTLLSSMAFGIAYRWRGFHAEFAGNLRLPRRQFQLRQLFLLTALYGVVLTLGRSVWPAEWIGTKPDTFSIQMIASLSLWSGLFGPFLWMAILRPRWRSLWLIPYFFVLNVVQGMVMAFLSREFQHETSIPKVLWILAENGLWNGVQMIPVALLALVAKGAGLTVVQQE